MRALGNVGVLRYHDAKNTYGYEHVVNLVQKGFITRDTRFVSGRMETFIHLKNRGQKYVRRYLVFGSLYKRSSYQLAHDLVLSKFYLSLTREEKKTWMNDYVVKKLVEEKDPEAEPVDGAYRNKSGQLVGVEVFTASYDRETVAAKLATLDLHFDTMEVLNA